MTAVALLLVEIERDPVDAVAFAGRLGAVVEDVAEVALAVATDDLRAGAAEAVVGSGFDGVAVGRIVETRPAGAGAVLRIAGEQDLAAARTPEHAVVVDFQEVGR